MQFGLALLVGWAQWRMSYSGFKSRNCQMGATLPSGGSNFRRVCDHFRRICDHFRRVCDHFSPKKDVFRSYQTHEKRPKSLVFSYKMKQKRPFFGKSIPDAPGWPNAKSPHGTTPPTCPNAGNGPMVTLCPAGSAPKRQEWVDSCFFSVHSICSMAAGWSSEIPLGLKKQLVHEVRILY